MSRAALVIGLLISAGSYGIPFAWAEGRPMKQLPADLVQWSTLWMEVPRQMVEVGKDDGPVAAVTWGPAQGAAMMIQSTTKKLWDAIKPDQRPGSGFDSDDDETTGLIFRYEF